MTNIVESIQINLSSKYATLNNNLTSDCKFYLNNTLEIPSQHYIFISLTSCNIPYSFYNINSSNNILNYTINNISYSLVVTQGNYNALNLVSYLNSNLQTGFTCSYNSITNKITFKHNTYEFTLNNTGVTILDALGFKNNLNSSNKTLISDLVLNLQTIQTIYMMTNLSVGNICICNLNKTNILASIPITTGPNTNILYINQNGFKNNLYSNIINEIHLKLVDENHKAIDLNYLHWSCTLQLDIHDFSQ